MEEVLDDDSADLAFLDLQDEGQMNALLSAQTEKDEQGAHYEDEVSFDDDELEDTSKKKKRRRKNDDDSDDEPIIKRKKQDEDEEDAGHVDVKSLLKNRHRGAVYLMERERHEPPCYNHKEQKYRTRVFKWRHDHLNTWMRIREQSRLEWHVQTMQPECDNGNNGCTFCRSRCLYWHVGESTSKFGIPPGSSSRLNEWGLRWAFEEFRKECPQMPDKSGINWFYFKTSHQLKFSSVYWKPTFQVCCDIVQLLCRDNIVISHLNIRDTSRHLADFLLFALLFHVNHATVKQLRILYRLHRQTQGVGGTPDTPRVASRCIQVQRLRHLRDIRESIRSMDTRVPLAARILLHHIRYTQQ